MVDKDNEIITIFLMFKKLEEVSMIIEHMEDIKIHSNQTSKNENYFACKEKYRNQSKKSKRNSKVKRAKEIKVFIIFITVFALINKSFLKKYVTLQNFTE